jgi:pimeloyl-ACP methyl ester carboxylesterase
VRPRAILTAALLAIGLAAGADEAPPRHLIYLHGRIIQDQQSLRPRHPEWGFYELEEIRATFLRHGFVVTSEIRPRTASISESADRVTGQVRELLASGVPKERITVVGGSMGAAIALVASVRLQDPELGFAVLGACLSQTVPLLLKDHGRPPAGRLLSVRDTSDETSEPCPAWGDSQRAAAGAGLVVREIVLSTGQHHGFLYRPLPEWVDPLVAWATLR